MYLRFVRAALVALFMIPSAAVAVTYKCDMKAHTQYGWIPPEMFFLIAEDRAQAMVFDGYIQRYHGEPLRVAVKKRSAVSTQLSWRVDGIEISNGNNTTDAEFIATLNTQRMRVTVRVYINGGDINPSGSGTCAIAK